MNDTLLQAAKITWKLELQSHSDKNSSVKCNFVKWMSQRTNTNTEISSHAAKETLKCAVKMWDKRRLQREQIIVLRFLPGTHVFQNQNIKKAQIWERYWTFKLYSISCTE